jgi:hypothetical protein
MAWVWILVAVLVIVAAVAVAYALRERRSRALREGFGPENERTLHEHDDDRRAAEGELQERQERRAELDIHELGPDERERYAERWRHAQRRFVDEPAVSVADADGLVREVMQARGYPVDEDFERRAADVSVDHPEVVDHYRSAHEISLRTASGDGSGTEDLRQAMVHYRALFSELLGDRRQDHVQEAR